MSIKNIRSLGFAKGTLHKGANLDLFLDILKQGLTELDINWRDQCCSTTAPPGTGSGSGDSLFIETGTCISVTGSGLNNDPYVFAPVISPADGNILQCTEDGLYATSDGEVNVTNVENIVNNFIEDVYDGSYFLDGGQISWLQDYDYRVSAGNYFILGDQYHADETDITLSAADPTNDRIDLVVANILGQYEVIEGIPSGNPAEPSFDPETQIALAFITVVAGTTADPCAALTPMYEENLGTGGGEFNTVSSSGTINVNSTSNPRTGSKVIEATNVAANSTITFTPSAPIDVTNVTNLTLYIRSKGTWQGGLGSNKRLAITFRNGSTGIGTTVLVRPTGTFGFNSALTGVYQKVTIPRLLFNSPIGVLVTSIRIQVTGTKTGVGFYIDDVVLENNCINPVIGGTLTSVTANSGLSVTTTGNLKTIKLGGSTAPGEPLLTNRYIDAGNRTLFISGASGATSTLDINSTATAKVLNVTANLANAAIQGNGVNGIITSGIASGSGTGLFGSSNTGAGIVGNSNSGLAGRFAIFPVATNTVNTVMEVIRSAAGLLGAAGIGGSIDFLNSSVANGTRLSNRLSSTLLDANLATLTSQFDLEGLNNGSSNTILSAHGSGVVGIGRTGFFTATRLEIEDSFLAGASMVKLSSDSTLATGDANVVLEIQSSGANAGPGERTYGIYVNNSKSGAGLNYAGYFEASGGNRSHAILAVSPDDTAIIANGLNGLLATATGLGTAIGAFSENNVAVYATSENYRAGQFHVIPASTSTVASNFAFKRDTTGTPANGIGLSVDFEVADDTGIYSTTNQIISKWTEVATATRKSEISITGVHNAALNVLLTISGEGIFVLAQGLTNYANDAAAAVGGIPVNGLYRTGSAIQIRVS